MPSGVTKKSDLAATLAEEDTAVLAPSFATEQRATEFVDRMNKHRGQLPRRAYVIAAPSIRDGQNWEKITATIQGELPGIELLDFMSANLAGQPPVKGRYEQAWPELLDTLGAVVAVPSRLNDQPTLGRAAAAELQAAVSHGLPAFLYDRKNFTLHTGVDCRFAVIPPAELAKFAKSRRYFPRHTIAVFMPRPSRPYLPTKRAAFEALGLSAE